MDRMMGRMVETGYLRAGKAACFRAEWERYEDRSGRLGVRELKDVAVRAMGQRPGVEQDVRRFIDDCDFYAECVADGGETTHVEGRVLYAGYMRKSWGHFLMNSTARLWPLFKEGGNHFDKIVFFAEDESAIEPRGNFREFLALAGILDRCVILPEGTYRFDSLTVGDISLEIARYVSAEFLLPFRAVRETALAKGQAVDSVSDSRGIIFVRSGWNNNDSVQINVRDVERLFTANGYGAVRPEATSLTDLIVRMQSAREVVSFSGSTAHNILFAAATPLTILERCALNNIYQIGIMKLTGRRTTLVDCFYQPLLAASTDNLTIYGLTDELRRFATDRGMRTVEFGLSPRREFARYLKVYRRHYGYGHGIKSWELDQASAIIEACEDSRRRYERYVDRRCPVLWSDFLSPRVLLRLLKDSLRF